MRTASWRTLLPALITLMPTFACSRSWTNGFWFERPDLVHMQVEKAPQERALAEEIDCTPDPKTWTRVDAERQLPVDRDRFTVWLSPGRLRTDSRSVELTVGGKRMPTWKEGERLQEPSFLYSAGGFLQAGLYLALPAHRAPSDLAIACRQAPPRWSRTAAALREGREPLEFVRSERMGHDSRPALLLPAGARVVFDRPHAGGVNVQLAVACRQPGPGTRIELVAGEEARSVDLSESERWQALTLDDVRARVEIVHSGNDNDQCFVADPVWVEPTERPAPGLLLVIVDGLRHDVAGDSNVMPHLTERARSAAVFTQARVTAPWTRPSVTSMLTGLAPREHGLETEGRNLRLAGEIPILPEILREHGYATASFSANPWLGPDLGLDRGFARLMTIQADAEHVLYEARLWIEAQRGPWFAVVFLMDTHFPFRHRPDFDRTSGIGAEPLDVGDSDVSSAYRRGRGTELPDAAVNKTRGLYLENVARVDEQLDSFFTLLGPAARDAVVVVTADHGEAFGEHGDFFHGWNLYDELLRVPLLINLPDGTGGVIDGSVSLTQLASTLAELASVNPSSLAGAPLPLPGINRATGSAPVFASTRFRDTALDAVIWKRWKLITAPRSNHCQLYDLVADPGEVRNLCRQNNEVRQALEGLLDAHRAGRRFEAQINERAGDGSADALESLGYLNQ